MGRVMFSKSLIQFSVDGRGCVPSLLLAAATAKSLQSCLTLSNPMDCSPPGSSVHGIFQARVLEWGAIAFSPLLLDLRPNYGGGNEDNGDLFQKVLCRHCYIQCSQPFRRPPLTHASTGDSWTLTGKSGQFLVESLLLSPGTQGSICALQESISQSCASSGSSVVGLKATSSKRAYAIPKSLKIIKSADIEINKNLKCNQNLLSISLHFEWLFLKKNLQ